MKNKPISKMDNEELLIAFLSECWMYGYNGLHHTPMQKEILSRMKNSKKYTEYEALNKELKKDSHGINIKLNH